MNRLRVFPVDGGADRGWHGGGRRQRGRRAVATKYDLSERLPYLINRIGATLVAFARPGLERFHLTIPFWRVLAVLAHKGEMRQVDLAQATSLDAPTVSRLISTAVRRGLVTRARSDTSNREVLVKLTRAGRDIVDQLVPRLIADENVVLAGLSKAELATLKKILKRMYENIAQHHEAAEKSPPRRKR